MTDPAWRIEDEGSADAEFESAPGGALVTWYFLRGALRRRWLVWVGSAVVGLLLGLTVLVELPSPAVASFSLLLAHDPQTDPARAMATDVSLLTTRVVASKVISAQGLHTTPESFLKGVTAQPATDQVLVVNVKAPTGAQALRRAQVLAQTYLTFRSAQLRSQSDAVAKGLQAQIAVLQGQIDQLTKELAVPAGTSSSNDLTDLLSQQQQLTTKVTNLQQSIEDLALRTASVVSTSAVLDSAALEPKSAHRRAALDMVSGIIVGGALGIGLVLVLAITSSRLRRRVEIATALGAPIRVGVGRVRPRRVIVRQRLHSPVATSRNLAIVQHALRREIQSLSGPRPRLLIAALDSTQDAGFIVSELAQSIARDGHDVVVVDLAGQVRLRKHAQSLERSAAPKLGSISVLRTRGLPELVTGPDDPALYVQVGREKDARRALVEGQVVLVLAIIDPTVGGDHLTPWADDAVVILTAGASSVERVRSAGEFLRSVDLKITSAVVLRTDATDESVGLPDERSPVVRPRGPGP